MTWTDLSVREARKLAKAEGVKLPRVGYEVSLGDGRWIASTGHFQFGWIGRAPKAPFVLRDERQERSVTRRNDIAARGY